MSTRTFSLKMSPAIALIAAGLGYWFALRPRHLRYGATDPEVKRTLPGDDIILKPKTIATRAITIHAPAERVWPWLVQIGQGRGGLYSYDFLENLIGCDIHSANKVLPAYQMLAQGDVVRMGPEGYPAFNVVQVEPKHFLLLRGTSPTDEPVNARNDPMRGKVTDSTWLFYLDPIDEHTTRLIVRSRGTWSARLADQVIWRITEGIQFVMEEKMLRGVRDRVEAVGEVPDAELIADLAL